jgi:hypothetical protein
MLAMAVVAAIVATAEFPETPASKAEVPAPAPAPVCTELEWVQFTDGTVYRRDDYKSSTAKFLPDPKEVMGLRLCADALWLKGLFSGEERAVRLHKVEMYGLMEERR